MWRVVSCQLSVSAVLVFCYNVQMILQYFDVCMFDTLSDVLPLNYLFAADPEHQRKEIEGNSNDNLVILYHVVSFCFILFYFVSLCFILFIFVSFGVMLRQFV